jgi:hypothetical protein
MDCPNRPSYIFQQCLKISTSFGRWYLQEAILDVDHQFQREYA